MSTYKDSISKYNLDTSSKIIAVSTFRTLGSAASPHNLFSIENGVGSTTVVAIRQINLAISQTGVLTALDCQIIVSRPASLPTGGTTLTKVAFDLNQSSNASVICRGATASDGGSATAITATAGSAMVQDFVGRLDTLVGSTPNPNIDLFNDAFLILEPIILRANQSLLVQLVNPTGTNNLATNHHIINVVWEEIP